MSVSEFKRGCRFVVGASVYGFGVTALIVRVSGFSWRVDMVIGVCRSRNFSVGFGL